MALAEILLKYPGGKFRKARTNHKCDNIEPHWKKACRRPIVKGEIFFDPRIAKNLRDGHYELYRICGRCAGIVNSLPQFELFVTAPVESRDSEEKRKQ